MHVMLTLTKGHMSNKDRVLCRKGVPIRRGLLYMLTTNLIKHEAFSDALQGQAVYRVPATCSTLSTTHVRTAVSVCVCPGSEVRTVTAVLMGRWSMKSKKI